MLTETTTGLTSRQVGERAAKGLLNTDSTPRSKSVSKIFAENIFTLFNLINFLLAVAVFLVGSYKNMLFMGVVACNLFIGIIQEIRAKRSVDRLSLSAPSSVTVVRDGARVKISHEQLVIDDVVVLLPGEQIKADCVIADGECDVNEAFITGEADAVAKTPGDGLFAGSFVVGGSALARVSAVGGDNYISKISNRVKYVKKVRSEIMTTLKTIIRVASIVIIPAGLLLFCNQYAHSGESLQNAVINTVAALIGMIPEGLVLLTSSVLAVAVIRLAKSKVLVQSLYCIETLARVDTLCLDKTGTITEGIMEYCGAVVPVSGDEADAEAEIAEFVGLMDDENPIFEALKAGCSAGVPTELREATVKVAFDSSKKWSGVTTADGRTIALGADGFVLKTDGELKKTLEKYEEDYRVLILAAGKGAIEDKKLPNSLRPVALLLFRDKIRDSARDTMRYFTEQGVELKVISGDSAKTVSRIAGRAGIENYDRYVDASGLSDGELSKLCEEYTVFGRVSPSQKRVLVEELQKKGRTVAMTGDGVNDVMALKEADCSIAMASGTAAARNVSEIVLVNSDFSAMPRVVRQGRQSINNIQRSASLFLVKNIYSMLLAVLFIFISMPYPFIPIQLTLISALTIGVPSFVLALEPNNERVRGVFLHNILGRALPGGLATVLGIITVMLLGPPLGISGKMLDTVYVMVAAAAGLAVLFWTCLPFNKLRTVLFSLMTAAMAVAILFFKDFFVLSSLDLRSAGLAAAAAAVIILLVFLISRLIKKADGAMKIHKKGGVRRNGE